MSRRARRHRAQAGTTLVELVVSVAIIGIALVLLMGAFSTALVDSRLVKRNTASEAAVEFELGRIQSASFSGTPQPYSECFSADTSAPPTTVAFGASCPDTTSLRLDVTENDVQAGAVQQWTVEVLTYPALAGIGSPVSVYKIDR